MQASLDDHPLYWVVEH